MGPPSARTMFHEMLVDGLAGLPTWQMRVVEVALIIIFGWLFMTIGINLIQRGMRHNPKIDDTLTHFTHNVLTSAGWIVIAIMVLASLGVPVAALAGGLGIGGFVLGFALKDTLGNLAAGVMLLFYRPFNMGDTVTISGETGDVASLGMALTTMKLADGRIVTVPNGNVLGSAITNHTRLPVRRADVLVGIHYDDDIDTAVKAIMQALPQDPRVLPEPPLSVRITELGNSSVGLQVRPWVRTGDFWQAKADFHAVVKRAIEDAGCRIPYPQTDVHLHQVTPAGSL